jgi:hypothetical protein
VGWRQLRPFDVTTPNALVDQAGFAKDRQLSSTYKLVARQLLHSSHFTIYPLNGDMLAFVHSELQNS